MTEAVLFAELQRKLFGPARSVFGQVPRALVASAFAAAIDFAMLIFLVESCGWHPVPAAVVGYLMGGVLQYILCVMWVFQSGPGNVAGGFTAFVVLSLFGLGITWLSMSLLHNLWGVNYAIAKTMALGSAFTWNFLSRKYLLFRPTLSEASN